MFIKMRLYQTGKIYCLRSHSTDHVYIGSTINTLSRRMAEHRRDYKRYLNGKFHYVSSFKILKYEDAYIELVEDCPCETKEQLLRREGQIMRETDNYINERIEGRTKKEHYEDNKEHIKEYKKKWYDENKEEVLEKQKQYQQENKEAIAEKRNQKYTCECGGRYTLRHKAQHMKTKKHQNFISTTE
jgi:hypothetical protein